MVVYTRGVTLVTEVLEEEQTLMVEKAERMIQEVVRLEELSLE